MNSLFLIFTTNSQYTESLSISKQLELNHGIQKILISALCLFLSVFIFFIYTSSVPQRSKHRSFKIQENTHSRFLISYV